MLQAATCLLGSSSVLFFRSLFAWAKELNKEILPVVPVRVSPVLSHRGRHGRQAQG